MFNAEYQNVCFPSNTSNLEALMDACFPRQHKAHVEAYLYHQEKVNRTARNAAIDAHLMQAVKELRA